jgi:hypothetical protein
MALNLNFLSGGGLSSIIPSPLVNAVTGYNNLAGNALSNLPQVPQYFSTVPFANNQTVLYKLQIILDPSKLTSGLTPYIFPLTPSNVTKTTMNLTNYYDVQGSSNNYGVQRIIDVYGLTPPIITIAGTTGFQFHSLDGYKWSGKSSFALLIQLIQTYTQKVVQATQSSQIVPIPTMIFTDGYTGEQFNIVPISKQAFEQDVSKPIIQTYNLQFLAQATVTPTAVALSQQDPIAQAFIITTALQNSAALTLWNSLLSNISTGTIS